METIQIKTSWGSITLAQDADRVIACSLPRLDKMPREPFAVIDFPTMTDLVAAFPKVEIPGGTEFQEAVWREIEKIPRGETRTYSEIATAIGRPNAARAVGTACGANPLPLFIPCHRVTGANGSPGGYSAGLPWKKLFLDMEVSVQTGS